MKKFGTDTKKKQLWTQFKKLSTEMLSNSNLFHYKIYVAKNQSHTDKECDDRLVVRLGLLLQKNKKNTYVMSNDYYRSIDTHWKNQSKYKIMRTTTSAQKNEILKLNDSYKISDIFSLRFIRFSFFVENKLGNILEQELTMSLTPKIIN